MSKIEEFKKELSKREELYTIKDCIDKVGKDLTGKILVINPKYLKKEFKNPQNKIWIAKGGFGCNPNAAGRAVIAECLMDGEKSRWNKGDFIGILNKDFNID